VEAGDTNLLPATTLIGYGNSVPFKAKDWLQARTTIDFIVNTGDDYAYEALAGKLISNRSALNINSCVSAGNCSSSRLVSRDFVSPHKRARQALSLPYATADSGEYYPRL
jgi:hypothetical protein